MSESLVELRDESGVFVAEVTVADLNNVRGATLTKQLMALVPKVEGRCLFLDLSAVRSIGDQGIVAAFVANHAALAACSLMSVCIVDRSVRRAYVESNIAKSLEIHDDLETAIRSMRGG